MTPFFKGDRTADQVSTAKKPSDVAANSVSGVAPSEERRAAAPEEISRPATPMPAPQPALALVRDPMPPIETDHAAVPPSDRKPATPLRTEPLSVREIASATGETGMLGALARTPREKTALTHAAFQSTRQEALPVRSVERETEKEETSRLPVPTKGPFSGIKEEGEIVVSKPREWRRLWARHMHNVAETAPPPAVDFNKEEVIAIFAGPCASAGYAITINRIEETEWEGRPARIVRYTVQPPPAGTMAAAVVTHPYLFQVVPRLPHTFFRKNPQ